MNEQGRAKIVEAVPYVEVSPWDGHMEPGEQVAIIGIEGRRRTNGKYVLNRLYKAGLLVMEGQPVYTNDPDTPQLRYLSGPNADNQMLFFDLNAPPPMDPSVRYRVS